MLGASARYSCLHTPVETVTSPRRRQTKVAPFRFRGLRKSRENFISAPSVFLSNLGPLRWAQVGREHGSDGFPGRERPEDQHFSGSGYSTPKVSTVTFFMTCGIRGLSL